MALYLSVLLLLIVVVATPAACWLINNYRGWSQEWDRTHDDSR